MFSQFSRILNARLSVFRVVVSDDTEIQKTSKEIADKMLADEKRFCSTRPRTGRTRCRTCTLPPPMSWRVVPRGSLRPSRNAEAGVRFASVRGVVPRAPRGRSYRGRYVIQRAFSGECFRFTSLHVSSLQLMQAGVRCACGFVCACDCSCARAPMSERDWDAMDAGITKAKDMKNSIGRLRASVESAVNNIIQARKMREKRSEVAKEKQEKDRRMQAERAGKDKHKADKHKSEKALREAVVQLKVEQGASVGYV